jgi:hypothetical protein
VVMFMNMGDGYVDIDKFRAAWPKPYAGCQKERSKKNAAGNPNLGKLIKYSQWA